MPPSADQNWRATLWLGLAFLALGLVSFGASLTLTPLRGGSWVSALMRYNWLSLSLCLFVGIMGAFVLSGALESHERETLRRRARSGDAAAMRLAGVALHDVAPADLERAPLEIVWRARFSQSSRSSRLIINLALFVGFTVFCALTTSFTSAVRNGTSRLPWIIAIVGIGALTLVVTMRRLLRPRQARTTGLVATSEGLRTISAGKQSAFIPWNEARLLEAWSARYQSGFALSSDRALVEWRDYPIRAAPLASGGSGEEMRLRLLQTVITRTGLEPRTLQPAATMSDSGAPRPQAVRAPWRVALLGWAFLLALAAVPSIVAANALLIPLTHAPILNLYIAVTMGALAGAILALLARVVTMRLRGRPARPGGQADIHLPAAPQLGAESLVMRVRKVSRGTFMLAGVLLLIAGDVYALVRGFIDSILPLAVAPPWWDPRMFSIIALGVISVIIGAPTMMRLVAPTPRVVLEERGLWVEHGANQELIPWAMVGGLMITVSRRGKVTYAIMTGGSYRSSLRWPNAVTLRGAPPTPGEAPGAVFAAALAQRAGLEPQVVYL